MTIIDLPTWQQFFLNHPEAHILQSPAWGELKSQFGWTPVRILTADSGVQILFRSLPMGYTVAYIPKGPIGIDWQSLWPEVDEICRQKKSIFLKVEPDGWDSIGNVWASRLISFTRSIPVQPRRTVEVSLAGNETDWLARMKQKTRYNIRLSEKKGVVVRETSDISSFYQLMKTTGERDQFGVHTLRYYQKAYELFVPSGACTLLMAFYEDQPLAGVMVFATGDRAWYFYGASSNQERNRMPAYLVQYHAMKWAASRGCKVYDLWGIPDADESVLEEEFSGRDEGLWGVYRFKRGFSGEIRRSVGAWDKVFKPILYKVYQFYSSRRGGE